MGMNPSPAGLEGVLEFAMIFLGGGGCLCHPSLSSLFQPFWSLGGSLDVLSGGMWARSLGSLLSW